MVEKWRTTCPLHKPPDRQQGNTIHNNKSNTQKPINRNNIALYTIYTLLFFMAQLSDEKEILTKHDWFLLCVFIAFIILHLFYIYLIINNI